VTAQDVRGSEVAVAAPRSGLSAWALTRRIGGGLVITAGVAAVLGSHQDLLRAGVATLIRSCPGWVVAGVALECASLLAFALLQRRLLGASGAVVRLRSVMCTTVNADAISTSVPVAGSGLAMAFAYRDFRRMGADAPTAATTPLVSSAMSAAAFVVLVAAAAAVSGSPGVAALGALGVALAIALAATLRAALRSVATRGRLPAGLTAALDRTGPDRADRLLGFLDRCTRLRLSRGSVGYAALCAAARWSADALCLVAAIEATGGHVPWGGLLLAWAAGAATTTLGLTPGGIGAADAVLVAALIGVGLGPAGATAAVVLYRLIALKLPARAAWFAYRRLATP
jgi:putative heme transporter